MTTAPGTASPRQAVSRRWFVALSAAALLPLAGGVGWALRLTRSDSGLAVRLERLRTAMLERRYHRLPLGRAIEEYFDYLQIEPGSIEQYLAAYEAHRGDLGPPVSDLDGVHRFLLSTDFFRNGADERKPVRFVVLYSPLVTPCYRPFV